VCEEEARGVKKEGRIALINSNRIRPPIAPIGLEYIAETLIHHGYVPDLLDLTWEPDWPLAMRRFFSVREYDMVGVTLRNTDDCAFTSRHSFLPEIMDMLERLQGLTDAFIVLGGVGFSAMPGPILRSCSVDAGVLGPGEETVLHLLQSMAGGAERSNIPTDSRGLAHRPLYRPAPSRGMVKLPPMRRRWLDNVRYFREGGQAGIETKRGCPWQCAYCCEPLAKGKSVQVRPPSDVAEELGSLLEQGIDHLHTCDSEFNLPMEHALRVCEEILERGLGDRLRWYAYCTPVPFSEELARLMKKSGCVGVNFGADSGDEALLRSLSRGYRAEDVIRTVRLCREQGIIVMLDLIFGSPGENAGSIAATMEMVKRSGAERIGISTGVRVWPGTGIASLVLEGGDADGMIGGDSALDPLYFIEPSLSDTLFDLINRHIGGDERFFFFNPDDSEQNYNYDGNEVLVDAIGRGYRGAYWDILRRLAEESA
jgi:radical SAM superfamily enzyme YgiQ (UPF0313 family)